MRTFFLLLFFAVIGAGCRSSTPQQSSAQDAPAPDAPLAGPTWRLTAFGADNTQPVIDDPATTASFSEEGFVTGSGGCNQYRGAFVRDGSALAVSRIGSTKRACAPPVMAQEQRFFDALQSAEGWTRAGLQLDLVDGSNERVLRFTIQEDAAGTPSPPPNPESDG